MTTYHPPVPPAGFIVAGRGQRARRVAALARPSTQSPRDLRGRRRLEAMLLDALAHVGRAAHRADARTIEAFMRSFSTLGRNRTIDTQASARYGQERHAQPPAGSPAIGRASGCTSWC